MHGGSAWLACLGKLWVALGGEAGETQSGSSRAATDLLFTVDLGCRLQLTWISSEHFRNPRWDHSFQPATNLLFAATDLVFTATHLVFT